MKNEQITVKALKEMHAVAEAIFKLHGCQMKVGKEYREITYPPGTKREECLPRPPQTAIYRLTFPDGYEAEEWYLRNSSACILFYDPQSEPESILGRED